MKITGGRLALVLLGLVGIVSLGVMIGLQLLIIVSQNDVTVTVNTDTGTTSPEPPSPTPLPPSVTPLPMATLVPPPAVPPTLVLVATAAPATMIPAAPTATLALPTPVPPTLAAATVAPATPTETRLGAVDLRLGTVSRTVDCTGVTEIVQLVLEREFGLTAASISFGSVDELFAAVAATDTGERVDLTFCYIDPEDRVYLQTYGSSLRLIGGNYGESTGKRLYAISNSTLIVPLKEQDPCVYTFLKNLTLGESQPLPQDAAQWMEENSALIQSWIECR